MALDQICRFTKLCQCDGPHFFSHFLFKKKYFSLFRVSTCADSSRLQVHRRTCPPFEGVMAGGRDTHNRLIRTMISVEATPYKLRWWRRTTKWGRYDPVSLRAHLHMVGMLRFVFNINQLSLPSSLTLFLCLFLSYALSPVFHSINPPDTRHLLSHLRRTQSLNILPLKPGVGQC